MIVRMGLLQKLENMSREEFIRHWTNQHADIASLLPGLRAYRQNHVTGASQRGIEIARGRKEYDGYSQLWFDDLPSMVRAIDSQSASLSSDEEHFIADLDVIVTEPATVIPEPDVPDLVKHVSILRRRPEISSEQFLDEWQSHAALVEQIHGVLGYVRHVVVARAKDPSGKSGTPTATYDDIPIDGVAELWFGDVTSISDAFSSAQGLRAMKQAAGFLAEANAYLVDCLRIM